jgi:diguanylate cyclase (GGDEF)-like protein/PAS domain S-box-containing protein
MNTELAELQAPLPASNIRVLVIDDEPRLLSSLEALLKYKHYQVDTALGGKRACLKFEHNFYDLVLLDLNMSDVDGFAVMAYMADHDINAAIVVVSGETTFDAVRKVLRLGASDYVKKPYSSEELFATIDSTLHKKHLRVDGLGAIVTDSSEQEATSEKQRKSNDLFSKAEQIGKLGHWEWDEKAGQYITCSKQYATIMDMTVEQMLGEISGDKIDREFICEIDRERYSQVVDSAVESNKGWDIKYSCYTKSGRRIYLHEIGESVLDNYGVTVKTIGTVQDITEIRRVEEELQQSNALYRQAEAMGNTGHWRWDLVEDKMISCSDQYAQIYGMTVSEALDYFVSTDTEFDLVHPDDKEIFRKAEYDAIGQFKEFQVEYRIITSSGDTRHLDTRSKFVYDNDGTPISSFGTVHDITQLKEYQAQLERIAHYDVLTDLPNRVLLSDRLNQAMVQCQRRNQSLAVAYLDLDGFKTVNDSYGHDMGDKLLVALSQRMKEALREGDTLARIGGDEFITVMVDLEKIEDSEPILERLLKAAADPIIVSDAVIQVSASIGVTLYPQDGADTDQLMRHADQAMYIAKQAGKNRYHLFDSSQDIYR